MEEREREHEDRPPEAAVPPPAAEAAPEPLPEPEPEPEAPPPPPPPKPRRPSFFSERPESIVEIPRGQLAAHSRRDFILFGLGTLASATTAWWLLPDRTKARLLPGPWRDKLDTLGARVGLSRKNRERALDGTLTF